MQTTLVEVLKASDLEIHLFAEYCREHMCEEAVTFLLEVNMYSLLFDPLDLETQAQRIFNLYLDNKSEGRIAGVSDRVLNQIKSTLEAANVLHLDSKVLRRSERRASITTGITCELFAVAASEVMLTLDMDVWPRYKEAVLSNKSLKLYEGKSPRRNLVDKGGGRPTKQAVLTAMRDRKKLEHLRAVASSQGMRESVDFCVEAEEYKLLFSEADRKPRAESLYKMYVAPGADLPVNLPDHMMRKVEKDYELAKTDLFEDSVQELLQVIRDNIFDRYLQEIDRNSSSSFMESANGGDGTALTPSSTGRGCGSCALM